MKKPDKPTSRIEELLGTEPPKTYDELVERIQLAQSKVDKTGGEWYTFELMYLIADITKILVERDSSREA